MTGKKSYGVSGMKEEVLDGVDIIVSGLIPRFEWIETDLSYAYWDSVASSDLYEIKLGLNHLKLAIMPEVICEPGRALVAESGSTIVRVNLRKKNKLYISII